MQKKVSPGSAGHNWFYEEVWDGQVLGLRYEQILHDAKSKYQQVSVCSTKEFGRVLILDNDINLTEKDESAYHGTHHIPGAARSGPEFYHLISSCCWVNVEMVTHLAMFSTPHPATNVLVVGGGDGGVVREVLKHSSVQRVVLCEIDEMVMQVSQHYFDNMKNIWRDPRLTVCSNALYC